MNIASPRLARSSRWPHKRALFMMPVALAVILATMTSSAETWQFAVSGDSRDCGNIVMPAIAAAAKGDGAQFYWHLGDLRAIYRMDADYAREMRFKTFGPPPSIGDYTQTAWSDFAQHQVLPFAGTPFFLGIGNHEVIAPKTVNQYRIEFASLLNIPPVSDQRAADARRIPPIPNTANDQTYNHWMLKGVDFINLDNAVNDAFDPAQIDWFEALIAADVRDAKVKSIVVGMHDPLPHSAADEHSMCNTTEGVQSGERVYRALQKARPHKPVYVVASHQHYYLADVYNSTYWRDHGGVLPGWIVGTAGAERYPLPIGIQPGPDAQQHVYGYLLGTVSEDGQVAFRFRPLNEEALQATKGNDYTDEDVTYCVANNPSLDNLKHKQRKANACDAAGSR